jgi:hypothetical protein
MDYRLLIVVDSRSPPHRDAITAFLRDLGYECWHWIDDLWLLVGVPATVTPHGLWNGLIASDPLLTSLKGLVLRIEGRPVYWGGNEAESWSWLLEHWGRPDFPRPLPSPVVLA